MILKARASPGTTSTASPVEADERGVVGVLAVGARVRPLERLAREALRSLHRGELGAVDGLEHAARGIDALDRVGDRQAGDDAVPARPHGGGDLVEHGRRRERPGGVVHEHGRRHVRQHGEPARDGLLAGRPRRATTSNGADAASATRA